MSRIRGLAILGVPLGGQGPATVVLSSDNAGGTIYGAETVTFTWDRVVTGFTAGDITVTNGSAGTLTDVGGGVFTCPITPTAVGTMTVQVGANVVSGGNTVSNTLSYTYNLDIDFSILDDGPLPAPLVASAQWSISSGVAVSDPGLGEELLTDPGLEATYTAGKCNTLYSAVGPTFVQSADVHGGSKAQEMTPAGDNQGCQWLNYTVPTAGAFIRHRIWGKRTAGTASQIRTGMYQASAPAGWGRAIAAASYTQYGVDHLMYNTNTPNFIIRQIGTTGYDTVILDDGSAKVLTAADLFVLVDTGVTDITSKGKYSWDPRTLAGQIVRANTTVAPTSYVAAWFYPASNGTVVRLVYVINGSATRVTEVLASSGEPLSSKYLELRVSGTTYQIFYGGVQLGSDKTIDNAALNSNTCHGFISTGGDNALNSFFLGN